MSFLRVQRGAVRRNQRNTVRVDAAWVSDGRKFVSKKKAGEYLWRQLTGDLVDGEKPTDFDQRTVSAPSAHDPRHVEKREAGVCRRVYRHGLLWRVTVENVWKSDHATMEDALAGVNPIGVEPGTVEDGVVVVPTL